MTAHINNDKRQKYIEAMNDHENKLSDMEVFCEECVIGKNYKKKNDCKFLINLEPCVYDFKNFRGISNSILVSGMVGCRLINKNK